MLVSFAWDDKLSTTTRLLKLISRQSKLG